MPIIRPLKKPEKINITDDEMRTACKNMGCPTRLRNICFKQQIEEYGNVYCNHLFQHILDLRGIKGC